MKFKDYYQILQVDSNATLEEIKQAYHRLAHKYHPDISQEANAEQRFKEIKLAYEVLKDPHQRATYTTGFKMVLPYSYEWFISKRNTWLNYFAQQQAKKDARDRVKLQWQSWKPRPLRTQTPMPNRASLGKSSPQLSRFFQRMGIAIFLMLLGIASYLGLQQVQTWYNHQQWQTAILQQDKAAIHNLEQADLETQRQLLHNNSTKQALVSFYLQQQDTPILTRLASYDTTIQKDILTDTTVYKTLTTHYDQQIATKLAADNFSSALQQLETLLSYYPASLEFKSKYEAVQQQKQQRLAQLTQQYMECLDQTLAPLLERTHCMVEARRKIEQVGIEHNLPNDPNLSAMYTEEIQHALAERAYDKAEKLLSDWKNVLPQPDPERQVLRKNLALHRQFNDITADLTSHEANKIAARLSQLTTDQDLRQKITQLPQVQKNLINYHLSEALALLNNDQSTVNVGTKILSQMKKILATQEPPVATKVSTSKSITATTTIKPSNTATISATKEKITNLLSECQIHYQANRLTTGKPSTAFRCYQTVLKLEPNNRQALNGLNNIQKRYLSWIESALRRNNLTKANTYIASLQRVNPQLPALSRLKKRLKQAANISPKKPSSKKVRRNQSKAPPRSNKSPRLPSPTDSPPPFLEPLPNDKPTCEECDCSKLLKQLSMGVKPLSSAQRSFFREQCR
jgi:hypothetical protein